MRQGESLRASRAKEENLTAKEPGAAFGRNQRECRQNHGQQNHFLKRISRHDSVKKLILFIACALVSTHWKNRLDKTDIKFNFKFNLGREVEMKTITMLDLRKNAKQIVDRAQHGERMLLLYRGQPAMMLEPYHEEKEDFSDDPLFSLPEIAEEGESLSNEQIDEIIYG
jgi:antitoxin (DNA-binding transcriptional repressor) of toxin-antitoxin stability system